MTFGLETVQPHGPGDYDINVQIVVSVGDINIPLQMVIHRLDTLVTYFTPSVGHRAQVFANQ